MPAITPAQIRGACGMLDWSKLDLAKAAHVSVSVVMNAAGRAPVRVSSDTMALIKTALEAGGIKFKINNDGIELWPRNRQLSVFSRFL